MYVMWCPTCGFMTNPDNNRQAVIAEWYLANQSCDRHIEKMWLKKYNEVHENRSNGTTVPVE